MELIIILLFQRTSFDEGDMAVKLFLGLLVVISLTCDSDANALGNVLHACRRGDKMQMSRKERRKIKRLVEVNYVLPKIKRGNRNNYFMQTL